MGLTKATITRADAPEERIQCLFNPTEYTIAATMNWQTRLAAGKDVPQLHFTGGAGKTLTLELFFDVFEQDGADVRTYIDKLWKLTQIDQRLENPKSKIGRPPLVIFSWGPSWSFKAAIQNLSVRYTLFRQDGTPVRATANITLQEGENDREPEGTNPTSRAEPGHKRREVRPNDTLSLIAHEEYGDYSQWRGIADANGIDDPLSIRPGQILAIPPLP